MSVGSEEEWKGIPSAGWSGARAECQKRRTADHRRHAPLRDPSGRRSIAHLIKRQPRASARDLCHAAVGVVLFWCLFGCCARACPRVVLRMLPLQIGSHCIYYLPGDIARRPRDRESDSSPGRGRKSKHGPADNTTPSGAVIQARDSWTCTYICAASPHFTLAYQNRGQ